MATLEESIVGLRKALVLPMQQQGWGWLIRQRMSVVKEALTDEAGPTAEAWLAARQGSLLRERNALLAQLATLGPLVLEGNDRDALRNRLLRLVHDLERHRQRLSDLLYDSVALELGGSE